MAPNLRKRIDAMFARDTAAAAAFVVALWIVIGFVFVAVSRFTSPGVVAVLFIGALLVVVFNTVSITAMIRHYREEKDRIYGLDIEHQDAVRANNPDAIGMPAIDELTKETQ
jgi:hypothetical protein